MTKKFIFLLKLLLNFSNLVIRMALKRAKCDKNDVKIASFLQQNHKNRSAAGGSTPRPPSTVTIYLMTMPPFVTHLNYISLFCTEPKSDNFCAKNLLFVHPSKQNPMVTCMAAFTAVDRCFRRLWAADETS